MPSDDYTSVGGGGALKLKGAKVTKKKKKKDKSNLEKNLGASGKEVTQRESPSREKPDENEDEDPPESTKTESERRHDELRKKRVCWKDRTGLCTRADLSRLCSYSSLPNLRTQAQAQASSRHTRSVSRS